MFFTYSSHIMLINLVCLLFIKSVNGRVPLRYMGVGAKQLPRKLPTPPRMNRKDNRGLINPSYTTLAEDKEQVPHHQRVVNNYYRRQEHFEPMRLQPFKESRGHRPLLPFQKVPYGMSNQQSHYTSPSQRRVDDTWGVNSHVPPVIPRLRPIPLLDSQSTARLQPIPLLNSQSPARLRPIPLLRSQSTAFETQLHMYGERSNGDNCPCMNQQYRNNGVTYTPESEVRPNMNFSLLNTAFEEEPFQMNLDYENYKTHSYPISHSVFVTNNMGNIKKNNQSIMKHTTYKIVDEQEVSGSVKDNHQELNDLLFETQQKENQTSTSKTHQQKTFSKNTRMDIPLSNYRERRPKLHSIDLKLNKDINLNKSPASVTEDFRNPMLIRPPIAEVIDPRLNHLKPIDYQINKGTTLNKNPAFAMEDFRNPLPIRPPIAEVIDPRLNHLNPIDYQIDTDINLNKNPTFAMEDFRNPLPIRPPIAEVIYPTFNHFPSSPQSKYPVREIIDMSFLDDIIYPRNHKSVPVKNKSNELFNMNNNRVNSHAGHESYDNINYTSPIENDMSHYARHDIDEKKNSLLSQLKLSKLYLHPKHYQDYHYIVTSLSSINSYDYDNHSSVHNKNPIFIKKTGSTFGIDKKMDYKGNKNQNNVNESIDIFSKRKVVPYTVSLTNISNLKYPFIK